MWDESNRQPHGRMMNGGSESHHGPLDTVLLMLGQLQGGHQIILDTVRDGFQEQHHINRRVAEDVAVLKESIQATKDRSWWRDLPLKELAMLAIIALSGALQILQPGEVKNAVRSVLIKTSANEK